MKNIIIVIAVFLTLISCSKKSDKPTGKPQEAKIKPASHDEKIYVRVNQYDYQKYNRLTLTKKIAIGHEPDEIIIGDCKILVKVESKKSGDERYVDYNAKFQVLEGSLDQASVSVELEFDEWSTDNYVLMPSAVYNGNRYDYRRIRYSPKLLDPRDIGPEVPQILSDVPKLNHGDGLSRIQERSGGMATPSFGFVNTTTKEGKWVLFTQGNELGDYGVDIEESRDRSTAYLTLTSPVVREHYKYRITDNRFISDDKPADLKQGDEINISYRVYDDQTPTIQALYDRFFEIRKDLTGDIKFENILPFSSAMKVEEEKFNRVNWTPKHGYYAVGDKSMFLQDWQIGWTGGMISTLPLLVEGSDQTKKNVISNFNWLFPKGLAPSGLFWDSGEDGKWYGGDIRKPHTANWHLTRKGGDGLFWIVKQLMLMPDLDIKVKSSWKNGTRKCADAFVKIWEENGQIGQFVDNRTGEIKVGGSTSGAIVPAALALSARYFNDEKYLTAAKGVAQHYYDEYVTKGLTYGGPGDAMQNFDSESAYSLIESFVTLFEETGDKKWLKYAEESTIQFATWVTTYDYTFPDSSLFGQLGIHSAGAIFANTQNKHGTPGVCTNSGLALMKLYRYTGNEAWMDLALDISHNITQFQAHPQKPIRDLPFGYMSERVSTTDWLEGIGEIVNHTTWAETSLMLTYVEMPGVYVVKDMKKVWTIDHVKVELSEDGSKLKLTNDTQINAEVKILIENSADFKKLVPQNQYASLEKTTVKAGETVELKL